MVYHDWSDESVDWKGITNAAHYISDYCAKWGRLGGQAKEKFGTVIFYANFGQLCLHTLVYPKYVYNQFPTWLWNLDCQYIGRFLEFLFGNLFFKWQKLVYSKAYTNALKLWPHLQSEILYACDYPEYIKGHTRIEITPTKIKTHVLGLDGTILSTWTHSR